MFFCNYGNWKFTQYLHKKKSDIFIKVLNAKEKKLSDIFILILIMRYLIMREF